MINRSAEPDSPPKLPPPRLARAVESVRAGLHRVRCKMVPPFAGVLDLTMGFAVSQTIFAAARLGIADVLAAGPLTAGQIAERIDADPDAVHRLLRVLATQHIFRQRRDGRFEMTSMAEPLRTDAPMSIRPLLMMLSHPLYWEQFGNLAQVVRTGRTTLESDHDMGLFEFLDQDPETARVFNDAMTCVTSLAIPPILAAYDFTQARTIVDVGGGNGQMLAAVLKSAPQSRGVLLEQASLESRARAVFRSAGVDDRVTISAGSFFDRVPTGGDIYLLKHVVHDWQDDLAAAVLRRVREAMSPLSKLLVVETVIPPGNTTHFGKLLDLDMMIFAGGRERSQQEISDLLTETGFELQRVVPTVTHLSLIEAVAA